MDTDDSNLKMGIYMKGISKMEFTMGMENSRLRSVSTMESSKVESMKAGESIGGKMDHITMGSIEMGKETALED